MSQVKRKKPFVLLELIIALTLFALCIVPLIEIPLRALKNEYQTITRLTLHRLSDLAFVEIKTQLYAQQIPWKDLGHEKADKVLLSEKIYKDTKLTERCYAWCSSLKPGKKETEARLITIEVEFSHPSSPLCLIKRKSKKSKSFQYEVFATMK